MKTLTGDTHTKRLKRGHFVITVQSFCAFLAKTTVKGIAIRKINLPLTGPTGFQDTTSFWFNLV